ncbi:MAG: thioredoxin family protein [Niabella sp.]
MKHIFFTFILITLFFFTYAQHFETVKDRTGKNLLKGFVTDSILIADTVNYNWFGVHERAYTPDEAIVRRFSETKDSVTFLIFFGTWCADSHYVIPRFYKIAAQAGLDKKRITLFGLDRTKKDDAHFAANLDIAHVPTIIVLKNGKELGRVVEYGITGRFDEELAAIVAAAK